MATKHILWLQLGGTIAAKARPGSAGGAYITPSSVHGQGEKVIIDPPEGVKNVLKTVCTWESQELASIGSPDIMMKDINGVAHKVKMEMEGNTYYAGCVITLGSDTMGEFGTALDLLLGDGVSKPVVLTCSMRIMDALSSDAHRNLIDAFRVAASSCSKDRGPLLVSNTDIFPAFWAVKADANQVNAFSGGPTGPIGRIDDNTVTYFQSASRRDYTSMPQHVDASFPKVEIIYGHMGLSPAVFEAATKVAQGIVLCGMGAGCWTAEGGKAIIEFAKQEPKYPIVVSFRSVTGFVGLEPLYGLGDSFIRAGYLNPEKAAVILQIAMVQPWTIAHLKKVFHHTPA
ncbi:hypothetical protein QQS21_009179 [Conoideocrella luteorostrata]|uniref:asparaginase n=1 Tax=Conoideocrella luteorostrata TaxID=1105319 RepID=A0AAJ0FY14_9HYPO|nr:hypothetical protein QQS21_009179 [Conoideocrella luteorostrata]